MCVLMSNLETVFQLVKLIFNSVIKVIFKMTFSLSSFSVAG